MARSAAPRNSGLANASGAGTWPRPLLQFLIRIDWDGRFDSNILIRSLMRKDRTLRAHAGCGIVADSNPDGEAEELMWKLRPLLEALA